MRVGAFSAVALGVVRDALHQKIFYVLVAVALAMFMMVPALPSAQVGVQLDLLRDGFLGLISLMGFLLAVILAAGVVHRDLERRTAYFVLSKPLTRRLYYLAKFAGVMLIVALALAFSWLVGLLFIYAKFGVFNPGLGKALFTVFLECAILASLTLLLSVHASPVVSCFGTLLFYVVCHLKGEYLSEAMADTSRNLLLRGMSGFFYYILPNLGFFNINETVAHGERSFPVGAADLLAMLVLAASFTAAFLVVGVELFRRREI